MQITKRNGSLQSLDVSKIQNATQWACENLENCDPNLIELGSQIQFYDKMPTTEIQKAMILSAQRLISAERPNYAFASARLVLMNIYKEAGIESSSFHYKTLKDFLIEGVESNRLDKRMIELYNDKAIETLEDAIRTERDLNFKMLGLTTLYDKYLLRLDPVNGEDLGRVFEMPQHMFMRIAMGLFIGEMENPNIAESVILERIIALYNDYSTLSFLSSTPTLFNSGTNHPQMSSCYGNTVDDSLVGEGSIYNKIEECASMSKYAGGIGTDWHKVRAKGSHIQTTNGRSSGIVPFLKVFNDTSVAVNQGGKRNGAFSAYIEPWHSDSIDFMALKKNAGDERRRAHDIFPAWWVNDLLLKRYEANAEWTFFDPKDVPHLHELFGEEFEKAYIEAEEKGLGTATISAVEFWKSMIKSLMETGAPWITFKDEHNRRNPQQHDGVIHNTNLCTEISLNNKADESFVCNLGSLNLIKFVVNGHMNLEALARATIRAIRVLDNVIDINFYPSEPSRKSNLQHRPIGLGVMGYAEALNACGIDYESEEHLEWADTVFSVIHTNAIHSSCQLAMEKGAYKSFDGSLWSQGILTIDSSDHAKQFGVDKSLDWLREKVMKYGMRNCNLLAIAPTATIGNIAGTTACTELAIEPSYSKANLGGTFKVFDPCLMHNKDLCKYAYDIDQVWVIRSASVRQKWIDQAQSVNLFKRAETLGRVVSEWYILAHKLKLKSTYYLKTQKRSAGMKKAGEK